MDIQEVSAQGQTQNSAVLNLWGGSHIVVSFRVFQ